jgi:uncharacterized protein YfaS (alpha-2-macroglobulin family)
MKIVSFVLIVLSFPLMPLSLHAASREAQWKAVDEAVNKGLPRTAITNLDLILAGALRDKAHAEAAKAIAKKIVLEGNIQGDKAEEKITRMEAELAKAPKEVVPLLDTLQAIWYWHYFQNNRWRFMQRTATAGPPGKDFTTWDLPRLFNEIDKQFTKALAGADTLKRTPVSAFRDFLQPGNTPEGWRPTLYDFIAHEALAFYASGEQAGAKAEDAFEISADSPIFGGVEEFLAWKPETTDDSAPKLKAIRLHQELLRFHKGDRDPGAFILANIERLQFGQNVAFGESKNPRYKSALQAVSNQWADHELGAYAVYLRARAVHQEGDWVEARAQALRVREAWRETFAGKHAQNLIQEIEARSASVSTEWVWNTPWPVISVRYRNVTNVWLRAVGWDWAEFLDRRHSRPESLNDNERKQLLAKAPALAWSATLPSTVDFKERLEALPAPATLKPGFYFLIASCNAAFDETNNFVQFADFWVSELALVVRPRDGKLEGFVLEANSGEPVAAAEIDSWHLDNQGTRVASPATKTDELGFFTIDSKERRGHLIRARHNGREIASGQEYWSYEPHAPEPRDQTIFFTDRSLYRPGQTVQYKGIVVHTDQNKDSYETIAGREVEVIFADPNGKEIAKAKHRANDYGSFSGSFTAPRDRVMGRCRIYTQGRADGAAWFNVEEYKRPKFQVTLDSPKTAAKLNDIVSLIGKAESYTGAAVDGALVKWRVTRDVNWPWWGWYSWRMQNVQGSQEIAHGTARSDVDGSLKIEFVARPDPAVTEKDEASFTFTIHADVTDTAGETRSADRVVRVGFTALTATLSAEDWQTDDKPVELSIKTATLDGEAQTAEGTVKLYRLKEPASVQRPRLPDDGYWSYRRYRGAGGAGGVADADKPDLSDPNQWEPGEVVEQKGFTTDAEGRTKLEFKLGVGAYRAMLETQDRFGKMVTGRLPLRVLKPSDTKLAIKVPHLLAAPEWKREPGQEFSALWGTGYDAGRAFIEIEHRHKMLKRYWTKAGDTQEQIKQAVDESMRGGFTLHVTQIRENRAFLDSRHIDVPWSNKELDLKWEHFTSKLGPAQKETWTLVVSRSTNSVAADVRRRNGGEAVDESASSRRRLQQVAELVATLYDESLDAYLHHSWLHRFGFFRYDNTSAQPHFANATKSLQHLKGAWQSSWLDANMTYWHFPAELVENFWSSGWADFRGVARFGRQEALSSVEALNGFAAAPAPAAAAEAKLALGADFELAKRKDGDDKSGRANQQNAGATPDLVNVSARKNLNETAFFFPQLLASSNGVVKLQFTMPEALTTWRFMGFAHDAACRSGFLEGKSVTAKDLMVQPNPPRFLREGDTLEFTVKVSNQSATRQEGKVRLTFNDAQSGQSADKLLANATPEIAFDIPAKESRTCSWRIQAPDGAPFLTYKAVASSGRLSDGEEGYLPVLARRILVTESLPLPIRGQAGGAVVKKFEFEKLAKSGKSGSLVHQNLVVQMVSNPSWYAVMALPYLMEFPHECTEQTFNRFYANSLARSIANSDPKIRRVFDQWKGTPALDSPLEKNQDLKAVMLEETPWLRQANNESQARKNVGILFDANRLDDESERTLRKLVEMQLPDGAWPWFPGGRGNDYITLYITTGFGRLRHLGVDLDTTAAVKSLTRLDAWMDEHYRQILKWPHPEDYVPSPTDALYLYGRSFFRKDKAIAPEHQAAVNFFLAQSRKHWLKVSNRQSQGHLALALHRFNASTKLNDSTPRDIMRSLKERSVTNEEMGMFWRDTELSWWWYHAPIESQAMMIEAFDEAAADKQAVEECRVWLLKQKQTQDWKTTKATADAVYALLLRGRDILASDALVEVKLGGMDVTPVAGQIRNPKSEIRNSPEAGTGFYEKRFAASDIKPKLGEITVRKLDEGVAWGSVHWQYLEDMSKVTPHTGTPLKLKKALFTKVNTKKGQVLEPVKGAVQVGDEVVVRIELRVDRDMEYVHLKDQRGSGTEPVNVLSGYRYQDGLAYYESTRDTASHFFIDYLPKGVYVFEYSTRVQHRGAYQTGVASIQCMYAPEFNSHSESLALVVR